MMLRCTVCKNLNPLHLSTGDELCLPLKETTPFYTLFPHNNSTSQTFLVLLDGRFVMALSGYGGFTHVVKKH